MLISGNGINQIQRTRRTIIMLKCHVANLLKEHLFNVYTA